MYKALLLSLFLVQPLAPPVELFEPAPIPVVRQKMGEVEYVQQYAKVLFDDYELEYILPDGRRVDVLTSRYAYEVDWSTKYCEGLGQSLSYAVATNRNPGLILLMKGADDERYNQCLGVITHLRSRGYNFHFIAINVESGKIWNH
tara:strand:- start:8144 stop:8578 length:435 start_codon:yes stop_codon:yes gene_type:complete